MDYTGTHKCDHKFMINVAQLMIDIYLPYITLWLAYFTPIFSTKNEHMVNKFGHLRIPLSHIPFSTLKECVKIKNKIKNTIGTHNVLHFCARTLACFD